MVANLPRAAADALYLWGNDRPGCKAGARTEVSDHLSEKSHTDVKGQEPLAAKGKQWVFLGQMTTGDLCYLFPVFL